MTDADRILKHALAGNPIRVTDWNGPNPIDSGKTIVRVAARIRDLRDRGWSFERTGTHNSCAVYSLDYAGHKKPRAA